MDDEKQTLNSFLDAFYNLSPDKKYELISSLNIDFSSIRRALEHAAKPFIEFAANFSLERWLRGTILKTAEDRLQSGELNEDDAKHLTDHRDEFQSRFDSLMAPPTIQGGPTSYSRFYRPLQSACMVRFQKALGGSCTEI